MLTPLTACRIALEFNYDLLFARMTQKTGFARIFLLLKDVDVYGGPTVTLDYVTPQGFPAPQSRRPDAKRL
jgi:hypothetical protein